MPDSYPDPDRKLGAGVTEELASSNEKRFTASVSVDYLCVRLVPLGSPALVGGSDVEDLPPRPVTKGRLQSSVILHQVKTFDRR